MAPSVHLESFVGDADGGISAETNGLLARLMCMGSMGDGTGDGKCASCAKSDDILIVLRSSLLFLSISHSLHLVLQLSFHIF